MEVDTKVVELAFQNEDFETGVKASAKSLAAFQKELDAFEGMNRGVNDLGKSVDSLKTPINNVENAAQSMADRFSFVGEKIRELQNDVFNFGKNVVKEFAFDPVSMGLSEYQTKMSAILGMLNNSKKDGYGLGDVNSVLDELNTYADKTIYNFSEMTGNMSKFVTAGVDLYKSKDAVKGIANLAAYMNVDNQRAQSAMLNGSQAMSAGYMQLIDWKSFINAGMAGPAIEDVFITLARVQGDKLLKNAAKAGKDAGSTIDELLSKYGAFRDTLKTGWLDTEIMEQGWRIFSGEITEEELRNIGLTETQIANFIELGKAATDAATKVRSLTALKDVTLEAIQSGWTRSWEIIIGDLDESTELFTGASKILEAYFEKDDKWRNAMLQSWKDNGGRQKLIAAFTDVFSVYADFMSKTKKTVTEALFGTSDPEEAGKRLASVTRDFRGVIGDIKDWWVNPKGAIDFISGEEMSRAQAFSSLIGGIFEMVTGLGKLGGDVFSSLFGSLNDQFHLTTVMDGAVDLLGTIGTANTAFWRAMKSDDFVKTFTDYYKSLKGPVLKATLGGSMAKKFGTKEPTLEDEFAELPKIVQGFIKFGQTIQSIQAKFGEFKEGWQRATEGLSDLFEPIRKNWGEVWKETDLNLGAALDKIISRWTGDNGTSSIAGKMGEGLGKQAKSLTEHFVSLVTGPIDYLNSREFANKVLTGFDSMVEWIADVPSKWAKFKENFKWITDIWDFFTSPSTVKDVKDATPAPGTKSPFSSFLEWLIPKANADELTLDQTLADNLINVVDTVAEAAVAVATPIDAPEGSKSVLDVIGDFVTKLKSNMEAFDPDEALTFINDKLMPIATSLGGLWLAFQGGNALNGVGKLTKGWGKAGEGLAGLFGAIGSINLGELSKGFAENGLRGLGEKIFPGLQSIGESIEKSGMAKLKSSGNYHTALDYIKGIGLFVAEVAGSLYLLSQIKVESIQPVMDMLKETFTLIGFFAIGMAGLQLGGVKIKGTDFAWIGIGAILLSSAVGKMASLNETHPETVGKAIKDILILIFGGEGFAALMTKVAGVNMKGTGGAILSIGIASALLTWAVSMMAGLCETHPETIGPAIGSLLAVFAGEAGLMGVIGAVNKTGKQFAGAMPAMIAIGLGSLLLTKCVTSLTELNQGNMAESIIGALGELLVIFGGEAGLMALIAHVNAAGGAFTGALGGFIAIGVGTYLLTFTLDKLAKINEGHDPNAIMASFGELAALFAGEGAMMAVFGGIQASAGTMIGAGVALVIVNLAVSSLTRTLANLTKLNETHDAGAIVAGLAEIAALFTAEGVVMKIFGGLTATAGTMIGASVACIIFNVAVDQLTGTLKKLNDLNSQYSSDTTWEGIKQLGALMLGETGAIAIISGINGAVNGSFLGNLGVSVTMGAFSASVDGLATVVGKLDKLIIKDGGDTVATSVGYLKDIVGSETTGIVGASIAMKLLNGISLPAAAKVELIMASIVAMAVGIPALIGAINGWTDGGLGDSLDSGIEMFNKAGSAFGSFFGGIKGGFEGGELQAESKFASDASESWAATFDKLGEACEALSKHEWDSVKVHDAMACLSELNTATQGLQPANSTFITWLQGESGIHEFLDALTGSDGGTGLVSMISTLNTQLADAKIDNWKDVETLITNVKTLCSSFSGEFPTINDGIFSIFTGTHSLTSLLVAIQDDEYGLVPAIVGLSNNLSGKNIDWTGVSAAITQFSKIATAFSTMNEGDWYTADYGAYDIVEAINQLATANFTGLSEAVTNAGVTADTSFEKAITGALNHVCNIVLTYEEAFGGNATILIASLANGIQNGYAEVESACFAIADAMASAEPGAYQSGVFVAQGFANGIQNNTGAAYSAGSSLAMAANAGIKDTAMISSPSKLTFEDGKWTTLGYAYGMLDQAYRVREAANSVTDEALSGFDDKEAVVTLTPIIDSDAAMMRKDASAFGLPDAGELQSRYAFLSDLTDDKVSMESSIQQNVSYRYNNQLEAMANKLDELKNKVDGMVVVLDSGELVGGITDKVDRALGDIYASKDRGG